MYIYLGTSLNVSLIQHKNDKECHQKIYWKLRINKYDIPINITIQLIDSTTKIIKKSFEYTHYSNG